MTKAGKIYVFDSFDSAIQAGASICAYCHVHVIGEGINENGKKYCSEHCALFDQNLEVLSHNMRRVAI